MPGSRRRRLPRVTGRSLRALQKVFPHAGFSDPARSSPVSQRELKPRPAKAGEEKPAKALSLHPGAPRAAAEHLELAEARRRLLEAESERRMLYELETRVRQLHLVFVQTELRVAGQGEGLSRLGGGVAQSELYIAVHGQRLKKSLRRHRKSVRLLGLGGCVPWGRRRSTSAPPAARDKLQHPAFPRVPAALSSERAC